MTADWPMWAALNAALREDGWKLVLLLRLSPAIPFSVINYALGSSSLPVGWAGLTHKSTHKLTHKLSCKPCADMNSDNTVPWSTMISFQHRVALASKPSKEFQAYPYTSNTLGGVLACQG